MFTGIISHTGYVRGVEVKGQGARLKVRVGNAPQVPPGGSVTVNGACLSVAARTADVYEFDVVRETLDRTTLGSLKAGDTVNIEFPLRAGDPIGGHFVQGHVDGTGVVDSRSGADQAVTMKVRVSREIALEVVAKGSVAVDGVSLTVTEAGDEHFAVALIPMTLEKTSLGKRNPGDKVNVETDVLGKYARRAAGR